MHALVTGATGFVGGALARRLLADGWRVTAFGRNRARGAELAQLGAEMVFGDLEDAGAVRYACEGQRIVFHCGALSAQWGDYDDFYRANVVGTQNVIEGCLQVPGARLVFASTPSIYFGYKSRLNVPEEPRIPPPVNAYVNTKWAAERLIQMQRDALPAIILRPRAIFGEGDPSLLPRLLERLRAGRLPIIGKGNNIVDLTYIDNVVEALCLCAIAPRAAWGRAYNISNGDPVWLWAVIARVADALGYPMPTRRLPAPVAFALAGALERAWATLPLRGEPPLTRFAVAALANSTTLDITAARQRLGYAPVVGMDEAIERTIAYYRP